MSSTPQWYMAIGGQQVGPVNEQDVVNAIRSGSADATTLVFVAGMQGWTPLRDVPKFQPHLPAAAPPPVPPRPRTRRPPCRAPTRSTTGSRARTCSSSRSSSTRARASWPRPARSCT